MLKFFEEFISFLLYFFFFENVAVDFPMENWTICMDTPISTLIFNFRFLANAVRENFDTETLVSILDENEKATEYRLANLNVPNDE